MRTVVRGGTVVTATDTVLADVLIDDERIIAVVSPGTELAERFTGSAEQVIDATDRLVVPGGIDAHTHFGSVGQIAPVLDTFETGTLASAFGGTTTVLDFASPTVGSRLIEAVEEYSVKASGECAVDYGFHANTFGVDEISPKEMDILVDEGVTSFKMFMAYPDRLYSDDGQILTMMQQSAVNGGLIMMHAENGIAIDVLRQQAIDRGATDPVHHSLTRPPILEAEAVHRAAVLAHVAGVPVYIVHLSSGEALDEVSLARHKGWNVFAETCPQYLFLDLTDLERPDFDGSKYVCSPPLRANQHQELLWRGLRTNDLQVVATDHCPFCYSQKELGRGDFRKIPNGVPGVEHRMELMYDGAVAKGRTSLNRWVEICSTAPAKMFGLYPRKGAIAPGSDADLVIFDPTRPRTISAATHHMNVDYSVYEGTVVAGSVDKVLLRGRLIIDGDRYHGRKGDGQFLKRDRCHHLS